MAKYEIVEAEFSHIGQLCSTLRYDDWAELSCMGFRPFIAIRKSYRASHLRRSAFVDGELAAMWGLSGVMLGGRGEPWFLTSKAVERAPMAMVKEGRREVAKMLELCNFLEGIVPMFYTRAHRFLEVLGFELSEPFDLRGVPVRRYYMEI